MFCETVSPKLLYRLSTLVFLCWARPGTSWLQLHIHCLVMSGIDLHIQFGKMSDENVYLLFSLWHLAKALQRLGSGHRSRGDWPFLLRMVKSAPLAARKQAMDAALFFSAPWVPKPMINCREQERSRKTHKVRDAPGFFFDMTDYFKVEPGERGGLWCASTSHTVELEPVM